MAEKKQPTQQTASDAPAKGAPAGGRYRVVHGSISFGASSAFPGEIVSLTEDEAKRMIEIGTVEPT